MRERQFVSFFMLILSAIVIFPQNELRAYSCVPPPPPAEAFERSDAVFMATVTSFKRAGEYRRVAKSRLIKLWKGDKALVGEVFTGLNSAGCGFDFEVGETYLIYAFMGDDGKLRTNICTRTASFRASWGRLDFPRSKRSFFYTGRLRMLRLCVRWRCITDRGRAFVSFKAQKQENSMLKIEVGS